MATADHGQIQGRRIEVDKSPASLDPKVIANPHLERGQAIFRSVLSGIPHLTTVLDYTIEQGEVVDKSLALIERQPSADTSDGYVYRASTGNDRSLARIRNPKSGVYQLIGEGIIKLNDLDLRLQRGTLTPEQYAEQRKLAEPLGKGTGNFEEFIGGIYAIDSSKLLGSNRFWNVIVEAAHATSRPPLNHADSFVAGYLLYPMGRTALYTVRNQMGPGGMDDGVVNVRYKKEGKERVIVEQLRHVGTAIDQHGDLEVYARVANVNQPKVA